MTRNEMVRKNIALTFDFVRYVINHPEMFETLPDAAEIEFLETDLPLYENGLERSAQETTPLMFKVVTALSALLTFKSSVPATSPLLLLCCLSVKKAQVPVPTNPMISSAETTRTTIFFILFCIFPSVYR